MADAFELAREFSRIHRDKMLRRFEQSLTVLNLEL